MLHFTRNIESVNFDLNRTNKLIISIGDSFTYGDSAWDDELILKYPPQYINYKIGYENYDKGTLKIINEMYPNTTYFQNGILNFELMFQSNCFSSLLFNKLNNEWTVLNLGVKARGNFSAVSSLFLTDVDWEKVKELIVIYMPSSMNRVDMINDNLYLDENMVVQNFFVTAWPSSESTRLFRESNEVVSKNHGPNTSPWNLFQDSIHDAVWSTKYEIHKTILEFQFLQNFVDSKNGRLFVIPAFSKEYNKDYFYKEINQNVIRNPITRELVDIQDITPKSDYLNKLVGKIKWEKFHYPENKPSFYHYALSQSEPYENVDMLNLIGRFSKDNWIMPCGHPSAKSHKLISNYILNIINKIF